MNYIGAEINEVSVYYYYDGFNIFFRSRMEGFPVSYKAAANAGSIVPWASYQWNMLLDFNGDGILDFAAHLNGSTGGPSNQIDDVDIIWNNSGTNSLGYDANSNIHRIFSVKSARVYTSGASTGQLEEYDGNGNVVPSGSAWPDGRNTLVYDFGMTRGVDNTGGSGGYYVDVQFPLSGMDAGSEGGPTVGSDDPVTLAFSTANSLNNPFQKDAAYPGVYSATPSEIIPVGDVLTLDDGIVQEPIILTLESSGCGPSTLSSEVLDSLTIINDTATTTQLSVEFFYYTDANADGQANDAGSWTSIGLATQNSGQINLWEISWDSTTLPQGQYLIKVIATDNDGNVTDSSTQTPSEIDIFNNTCGQAPPGISKTVTPSIASVGGTVTYTITVDNTAGTTAVPITSVSDTLPSGFTFSSTTSVTAGGAPITFTEGGTAEVPTWSNFSASVPAGGTLDISFTATISASQPVGTYQNQVNLDYGTGTASTGNSAPVTVGDASLAINKTVDKAVANPGDTLIYSLTVTNPSSQDSNNVVFTDSLPEGITYSPNTLTLNGNPLGDADFATDGDAGEVISNTVTVRIDTMPAGGAAQTIAFQATVDSDFSGANPAVNTGSVVSDEVPSPIMGSVNTFINSPELEVLKTADTNNGWEGDEITFTLTYNNSGTGNALNVVLTDTLPSGLTFSSFVSGVAGSWDSNNRTITWSIGTLSALSIGNKVSYKATIDNGVTNGATVTNTATLSASNSSDTSDTADTTFIEPVPNPIVITKSVDTPTAAEGSSPTMTYTVTIQNDDPINDFIMTSITDVLPSAGNFTFSAMDAGSDVSDVPTSSGSNPQTLTWSAGTNLSPTTIVSGNNLTLIYQVTTSSLSSANSPFVNTATVAGDLGGTAISEIGSSAILVNAAGVTASKSVNGTTAVTLETGDIATYSLHMTKDDQNNANNSISDTLNSGQDFVVGSVNLTGTGAGSLVTTYLDAGDNAITPAADANGVDTLVRKISWSQSNGKLPRPMDVTATFDIRINGNATSLTNLADVANGTDSNTTTITLDSGSGSNNTNLTLSKSVDKASAVIGDTLIFTLDFGNSGTAASTNTIVKDTLPANTTYLADSTTLNGSGVTDIGGQSPIFDAAGMLVQGSGDATAGTVSAGESGSVTFQVTINTPVDSTSFSQINNIGTIESTEVTTPINSNTNTIVLKPNLAITKSRDVALLNSGEIVTYSIDFIHTGTGNMTNAVITDTLPETAYFTYFPASASTTLGTVDVVSGVLTANIGTLTPGGSGSVTFQMQVANTGVPDGLTTLSNSATMSLDQFSADISANSVDVDLNGSPKLTIAKGVSEVNGVAVSSPQTATAGDILTYELVYGNTRSSDALSVAIDDMVPANTSYEAGSLLLNGEVKSDTNTDSDGASYDPIGGTVNFDIGTLTTGTTGQTASFKVMVNFPMPAGTTTIGNSVDISGSNASTANASYNLDVTAAPLMNITKSAPSVVLSMGTASFDYTLNFSNTGDADASNITVTDTLASGLGYTSSTLNGVAGGSETGGVVTFAVGTLAAGATGNATITVSAPLGTYLNTADIDSNETTTVTSNQTTTEVKQSVTGTVTATTQVVPGLPVTITVDDSDLKGESLIFVTVTNGTTGEIEIVGLVETGVNTGIFTSTLLTAYDPAAGTDNNGTMFGQPGDILTTTYNDVADATSNPAIATATTTLVPGTLGTLVSSTPINAGDTVTITLTDPDLNTDSGTAETYQLLTTNSTTGEVELLTYTETGLDTGIFSTTVSTVNAAGAGTNSDGIFNVESGQDLVTTYTDDTTPTGPSQLINTTTHVIGADLLVTKTDSPDPISPGQTLTYTITISNSGPDDALDVVLTDTVPTDVQSPEYSADGTSWNPWTGTLNLGTITSATPNTAQVLIRGTVNPAFSGTLNNTVSVSQAPMIQIPPIMPWLMSIQPFNHLTTVTHRIATVP